MRWTESTLFIVLAFVVGACASQQSARVQGGITTAHTTLLISVYDETEEVVGHAKLYVISANGEISVSEPDELGIFHLSIAPDFRTSTKAILACAEGYYCGGWLTGDELFRRLDNQELVTLSITLAAIRLR